MDYNGTGLTVKVRLNTYVNCLFLVLNISITITSLAEHWLSFLVSEIAKNGISMKMLDPAGTTNSHEQLGHKYEKY